MEEFREIGLLWFINTILHIFGWAICCEIDNEKILNVYPARVKFRGFDNKTTSEGCEKVTEYLKENIDELLEETKDK